MADTVSVTHPTFAMGDRVEKISGSAWRGHVVGTYSTSLTPEGYAVESETEVGSVQIYPAKALRLATQPAPAFLREEVARMLAERISNYQALRDERVEAGTDENAYALVVEALERFEVDLASLLQGKQP